MTNTTEARIKHRSYAVRARLAEIIGVPDGHDFSTEHECLVAPDGGPDAVSAMLLSTSNAGFRGIEGRFVTHDGRRFTLSLGLVSAVANAGEWETI